MNKAKSFISAIALSLTTSPIFAVDFDVHFQNTSSGIDWSGVVDTTADTLSITDWAVTGNSLYPAVISDANPIIFDAVTGSDSSFDVPDNWDGSFQGWGFLSRQGWLNNTWTNKAQQEGGDFSMSASHNNKIGLGLSEFDGGARIENGKEVSGLQRAYTDSPTFTDHANGTVESPTSFTAVAVPEPSSAMLLVLGATSFLVRRKR